MNFRPIRFACFLVSLNASTLLAAETEDEQAITRALAALRGIEVAPDAERTAELNKRMDTAWRDLIKLRAAALPRIVAELRKEQAAGNPDQFLLLDLACLLVELQHPDAVSLTLASLEKIASDAPVIRANWRQLFNVALAIGGIAGRTEQPRYLRAVDRLFLASDEGVFRAEHVIRFGPTHVAAMLYGVAGDAAARHLAAALSANVPRARVLQILGLLGSEEQVAEVRACIAATADIETFKHGADFLLTLGGPAGRAALLTLDEASLREDARAYLREIRPQAEAASYQRKLETLRALSPEKVGDARLRRLLDTMEARDGEDSETPPAAIVESGLPTAELLAQMNRIRARSFRRASPHALDDLPVTNAVINALQFKRAPR